MAKIFTLLSLLLLATANEPSLQLYVLPLSNDDLNFIPSGKQGVPSSLDSQELLVIEEILIAEFDNFKDSLKIPASLSVNDYYYQLVPALDEAHEKLVYVNAVYKHFPKWMTNGIERDWLFYKCVEHKLFDGTVHLDSKTIYDLSNMHCE